MMQSYATAGDFTVCGKLKSALFENAVIYGSYLVILLICIIYVAVKPNLHFNMYVVIICILEETQSPLFSLLLSVRPRIGSCKKFHTIFIAPHRIKNPIKFRG